MLVGSSRRKDKALELALTQAQPLTETVDDLIKLACALTKTRAAPKSKTGASFECAVSNVQIRW